jgi:hypothetical protein
VRRARCLLVGGKSRLVYLAGSANADNEVEILGVRSHDKNLGLVGQAWRAAP